LREEVKVKRFNVLGRSGKHAIAAGVKQEDRSTKLSQLSGILQRYVPGQNAKAMPNTYLVLDGHGSQPAKYILRGSVLESVETGKRVLVHGTFRSRFFHSRGAALSGWRVYMDVQNVEILMTPFDHRTGIPELD
jgi:hypothetical protein